jgi:hypothetical protein
MAGFCTRSFARWPWVGCSPGGSPGSPGGPAPGLRSVLLLAGGGGLPLDGQTIQGQLLDRDTELPVEGALVLLLDPEGRQHHGSLSNGAGRFLLRAPGPGRFRVRAERIGFETVRSDPFELASDQVFGLRLTMAQMAIELEGIRVEGNQRCLVRPEEGLQVARVWEEARKALALQAWTEQEEPLPLQGRQLRAGPGPGCPVGRGAKPAGRPLESTPTPSGAFPRRSSPSRASSAAWTTVDGSTSAPMPRFSSPTLSWTPIAFGSQWTRPIRPWLGWPSSRSAEEACRTSPAPFGWIVGPPICASSSTDTPGRPGPRWTGWPGGGWSSKRSPEAPGSCAAGGFACRGWSRTWVWPGEVRPEFDWGESGRPAER